VQNAATGQGGAVGTAGGFSRVSNAIIQAGESINDFVMTATGGGGGGPGAAPSAGGAAPGGGVRNFLIASQPSAMQPGAVGSYSTEAGNLSGPHVNYVNFRFNQGAGGGSATATTTAFRGGSININPVTTEVSVININYDGLTYGGITAGYGGEINLGNINGKGSDGQSLYKLGAGFQYFPGFGGAGGGAANTVGGGNGGDGYRGGGGGGGGGVRSATTLALNQVPSGAGGRGGNGYCRIIARK
jgi:hypothetical protein